MGTGQVEQQFAIARLRAIETGRPVVVAATNGVSGVVNPEGEVQARAPVRTQTLLVESVLGVLEDPLARDIGLTVKTGLVTVSVVSVLVALGLGYRRRSRREQPAPEPTSVEA
jgi:apolipoprotein N-acyltransferase